ncbi:MAG: ABC transporter permease [Christensenellales bacterium]|jgi:peptide/nickel transport system permease protein
MQKPDKKHGGMSETWRRFKKSKLAMFGLVLISIIVILSLCASLICDYEADAIKHHGDNRFADPSWEHPFGTDEYGRDIFARVLFGTRVSLQVGFMSTIAACAIACFLGSAAAYYGGKADAIIMRVLDIFMGIPTLLLAIAISASLGAGINNLIIALIVSQIPSFTRVVRSAVINVTDMEYIEAARAYGCSPMFITARHILPNALGTIIVQATMAVAAQILNTAALSYLGLGQQPPAPELGAMLSDAKEYMRYDMWGVVFPGLTIAFIALSLNLVGDGLRDALDPRLKN